MARRLKRKMAGKGTVLCGDLWVGKVDYEIQVVEESGSLKVFGYFVPEPGVLSRLDVRNAALQLKYGVRVKLQIDSLPVSKHVEFEIVDPESIKICQCLAGIRP
jgi:hypothetical protein